jgi:ferredoxin
MIYYFSGTGNSQYVAEQLANYTKDAARFIPQVFEEMQSDITVPEGGTIGIVFPVYAWAPPAVVMEFISHVHVDKKAFAYAVCTCGDETGKAMDELHRVFPFKSAYSITMPNNYIPMYDTDEPELEREKINVATQRLPKIASEIAAHREIFDVHEGPEASFKTVVINPLFSLFAMRTSKFSADDTCIGCGACEKNCAFHVITLAAKKPVWQEGKCEMCMSCIMRCPVHAIQFGSGTKNRGRYVFPVHEGKQSVVQPDTAGESVPDMQNGRVEIIKASDIRTLAYPGIVSRQLLTPDNSEGGSVCVTEVHMQENAIRPRQGHNYSEQILYALRGTSKLIFADDTERFFAEGDVVRFEGCSAYGLVNTGGGEFVYISVTSLPGSTAG